MVNPYDSSIIEAELVKPDKPRLPWHYAHPVIWMLGAPAIWMLIIMAWAIWASS